MSRLELNDRAWAPLQAAHPAFKPGAERQGPRDSQLVHRQENHEHDLPSFADVLTALSAVATCARTRPL